MVNSLSRTLDEFTCDFVKLMPCVNEFLVGRLPASLIICSRTFIFLGVFFGDLSKLKTKVLRPGCKDGTIVNIDCLGNGVHSLDTVVLIIRFLGVWVESLSGCFHKFDGCNITTVAKIFTVVVVVRSSLAD